MIGSVCNTVNKLNNNLDFDPFMIWDKNIKFSYLWDTENHRIDCHLMVFFQIWMTNKLIIHYLISSFFLKNHLITQMTKRTLNFEINLKIHFEIIKICGQLFLRKNNINNNILSLFSKPVIFLFIINLFSDNLFISL